MDVTHLVVLVAVLAIIWVLITRFIPMPAPVGTILGIVFAVIIILALLSFVGLGHFGLR
jgi:multisubunit Na+/H+ antiporter MnhE subunit